MKNNDNFGAEPPNKKEANQAHVEWLSKKGCEICREDNANELVEVSLILPPVGETVQNPTGVACEKHVEDVKDKNQCCLNPSFGDINTVVTDGYKFDRVECKNCEQEFRGA